MIRVLAFLLLLGGCTGQLTTVSGGLNGTFYKPDGPGPHPAVVLLHDCGGVGPSHHSWARRLRDWGYATMVVESFSNNICGMLSMVKPAQRAEHALQAMADLRARPDIQANNIAVVGFSHGANGLLNAVQASRYQDGTKPFKAAVGFYPYCSKNNEPTIATDTLILVGEKDDWTPASKCQEYKDRVDAAGNKNTFQIKVYEGAAHKFDDVLTPVSQVQGHLLGYHSGAAMDSQVMTKAFLDARLK